MSDTPKKPRLVTAVTPRGVFSFPWVNKPDAKFAKAGEKGDYKSGLVVEAGPAAALVAQIDAAVATALEKQRAEMVAKGGKAIADSKNLSTYVPYQPEYAADGEVTGRIKFSAKVNAEGKNDKGEVWSNKPAVFDAAGKPSTVAVYGGSEGKLSVQFVPFYSAKDNQVGITLRLKAVQILKVVSKGGNSAEGFGFGAEEGYVSDDEQSSGGEFGSTRMASDEFDDGDSTDTASTDTTPVDF